MSIVLLILSTYRTAVLSLQDINQELRIEETTASGILRYKS